MESIEYLIHKYVSRCHHFYLNCLSDDLRNDCQVISFKLSPVFLVCDKKVEKQFVITNKLISVVFKNSIMTILITDPDFDFEGKFQSAYFFGNYHQLKEPNALSLLKIIKEDSFDS